MDEKIRSGGELSVAFFFFFLLSLCVKERRS